MNEGNKSRTIAATNMNSESSRSHAVFCLKVSQNIVDAQSGVSSQKNIKRCTLMNFYKCKSGVTFSLDTSPAGMCLGQ